MKYILRMGSRTCSPLALVLCLIAAGASSCIRPPAPDYSGYHYLVLAPEAVMPSVEALVAFKESQGFQVDTVTLEEVLASSTGRDEAEKVRNYLKGYSEVTDKREFVLLVGSIDGVPMRLATTDPYDLNGSYSTVLTDYYYQELTCDWDADMDGRYGEWGDDVSPESCDYKVETWVGRLPWDEPIHVQTMVDAIIRYETDTSARMTKAIMAAALISYDQQIHCDAGLFVDRAKNDYMKTSGYSSTTIFQECSQLAPDFDLTMDNFIGQWEAQEPGFVAWFSHGDPFGSYITHSWDLFIDTQNIPQGVRPAIGVTSGCNVGDPAYESLGRLLAREGVTAGFVGSSEATNPGTNPIPAFEAQYSMGRNVIFERQALSAAVANAMEYYVAHEIPEANIAGPLFNQNIFEFLVYGDPALQAR